MKSDLIAREEAGELLMVCDEYDRDAWNRTSRSTTCVNPFPTAADAFREDEDCNMAADDEIGPPPDILFCPGDDCLCAGHEMSAEDSTRLRDIMASAQLANERNLRMEFDAQTLEHFGRCFDEL